MTDCYPHVNPLLVVPDIQPTLPWLIVILTPPVVRVMSHTCTITIIPGDKVGGLPWGVDRPAQNFVGSLRN